MIQAGIIALALAALIAMSVRADRRFRDRPRLPMQWSITGEVNWTAPRLVALCFMPVLSLVVLVPTAILSVTLPPRPGQEGYAVPVLAGVALSLVGAHALHLWLIGRRKAEGGR